MVIVMNKTSGPIIKGIMISAYRLVLEKSYLSKPMILTLIAESLRSNTSQDIGLYLKDDVPADEYKFSKHLQMKNKENY